MKRVASSIAGCCLLWSANAGLPSFAKGPETRLHPDVEDPADLLCTLGGKTDQWCKDWVTCIKSKATPEGADKVMEAWAPADCREACGVWPSVSKGDNATSKGGNATTAASFLQPSKPSEDKEDPKSCLDSCKNFQTSLSNCVGKILFEPGQIYSMKASKGAKEPEACSTETCPSQLAETRQKCMSFKASKKLGRDSKHEGLDESACKTANDNWQECSSCNKYKALGGSQFTAFVGGCIDQLHAYRQATHPDAGEHAYPEGKGCQIH